MTPSRSTARPVLVLVVAVGYLLFAVLAWFLGDALAPPGASRWVLRVGLWVLGLVAAGITLWFFGGASRSEPEPAAAGGAGGDEVERTLAAAAARLAAARTGGVGALRALPMVLVVGPEGSTKTSVAVHSGLEPDLLAGEVFHGDRIGPTPGVNVWYTHHTVLLEAGGALVADQGRWAALIRRIRPRRLKATLTGRAQSSRAVLLCYSSEELLKAGGAETQAAAQGLRALLMRLAQGFGVRLPVYVLFTKADRIPCFAEFAQQLSREEAQQVLGATLRWPGQTMSGLYADREFQRLNTAFDRLLSGLATKRVDLLAREPEAERQAGIYEFPRELRKLVPTTVQFLVDLCRPSQLDVSPVLRGFYYTGVRAVMMSDVAQPGPAQRAAPGPARFAATQVFDAAASEPAASPAAGVPGSRKVPQWLFLGALFRDVLLRDPAPRAVARGARSVALLRRAGLAAAAVLSLLGVVWSSVQYVKNGRAVAAAQELTGVVASDQLPTMGTLNRLETLRAHLGRLSSWRRWWFYKGSGLYPDLRRVYVDRFEALLLGPARVALLRSLDSLPDAPNATAQYGRAYDLLKAYLMTTSDPDKLAASFVVPVLLERWVNGRAVDPELMELARRQFAFYATTLCRGAPCGSEADDRAVTRTRAFLVKFTGAERIYQLMVSDASAKIPSVQFHRQFPGAAGLVADGYEVPGAFTVAGWASMQDALKHVDRFFQADDWVLGEQERGRFDRAKLVDDLRAMYVADYARRWEDFLAAGTIVPYGSAKDAAQKLAQLGGNQSPLLQLLWVVSQNTKVDSQAVGATFQPVHTVMPPAVTDRFVVEANQPYVGALTALQVIVTQAASAPPGAAEGLVTQTLDAARNARATVEQVALKFSVTGDAGLVGSRVRALLEAPIERVEHLLGRLPAAALNERGAAFCRSLGTILGKYPLKPDASTEASLPEVAGIFEPNTGALWAFYNEALQSVLVKQGAQYAPKPGGTLTPTPAFVRFFNRVAAVTDALWPPGATQPQFDFTVKLLPSDQVPAASFSMDGQLRRFTRTFTAAQRYSWIGPTARDVRLAGDLHGREENLLGFDGTWALFKLVQRARWETIGVTSVVQWAAAFQGQPVTLEAELNLGAARPILKGDYFAGMSCISQVVQ
jgi:type VI secretion system protein ImpL